MKAKKIMDPNPVTIHADATIRELVKLFDDKQLDAICVVENGKKLAGVITIFELFKAFLPDYVRMKEALAHVMPEGHFEKMCKKLKNQSVRSILRTDLITIKEEDNLIGIVADIAEHRLMALPVVRGDKLVGTIQKKVLLNYASKVLLETSSESR